jgi:four helix bundle protein
MQSYRYLDEELTIRKLTIDKMSIARKETRETCYWLRITQAGLLDDEEVQALIQESDELVRILYTIVKNARQSPSSKTSK